jgi:hypothetical protein
MHEMEEEIIISGDKMINTFNQEAKRHISCVLLHAK